LDFSC